MAGPVIDLSAREPHFLEHLAPVWRALDPAHRGTIHVGTPDVARRAGELGLGPAEIGWPGRGRNLGPILVASGADLLVCGRTQRRLVLFEHGAGQSYSNRHSSYVGGNGRDRVALFVVPNDQAAARNRRRYPAIPNAVVGSPKLDGLLAVPAPAGPPTVAISFHWRCDVAPEAGSALDDYRAGLGDLRAGLAAAGVALIGHGHPGIAAELEAVYADAGIEFVASFDDVVRRAHLYAVDNSSTLFEFAALGRPVVVLNARRYRRDIDHGLRFWAEANVGLNVDGPDELLPTILAALADPDDARRSREASVGRVYPVRDGTSAQRAAAAVVAVVAKRCLVCGAGHATCGGPTEIIPVDEPITRSDPVSGPLKRYPNPARAGAYLKLDEDTARRMGLTGEPAETPPPLVSSKTAAMGATSRQEPSGALSGPGRPTRASAAASAASSDQSVPPGAIPPGGVTHRARAAAKTPKEAAMADEEPDPAPDAPVPDDPKDKARPAPASRRRRKITE